MSQQESRRDVGVVDDAALLRPVRPRRPPRVQGAALTRAASASPATILFLAANPSGATHLLLDEEARDIHHKLRVADYRDAFSFKTRWALRTDDLQRSLMEEKPAVVHFSGHGFGQRGLVLTSLAGDAVPVSTKALRALFTILRDNVRVVVLNACYSAEQADAIAEEIDVVIGMEGGISDRAARIFSVAFYRALGFGKSVGSAFDLGVNALELEGLGQQSEMPVLRTRAGIQPDKIVLALSDKTSSRRPIVMLADAIALVSIAVLLILYSLGVRQEQLETGYVQKIAELLIITKDIHNGLYDQCCNEPGWGILESYLTKMKSLDDENNTSDSNVTIGYMRQRIESLIEKNTEIAHWLDLYASHERTGDFREKAIQFKKQTLLFKDRWKTLKALDRAQAKLSSATGSLPSADPFPRAFPDAVEAELFARGRKLP